MRSISTLRVLEVNVKSNFMTTMKCDMGGGAAVGIYALAFNNEFSMFGFICLAIVLVAIIYAISDELRRN